VRISKLADKTAESTRAAIISRLDRLPANIRKTITFDRGSENARWNELEKSYRVYPATSPTPIPPGNAARTKMPTD
jgi:IS30 family transposase